MSFHIGKCNSKSERSGNFGRQFVLFFSILRLVRKLVVLCTFHGGLNSQQCFFLVSAYNKKIAKNLDLTYMYP